MALTLDARHCGRVWILRCQGRIVAGETALEQALERAGLEFARIVVNVAEVARIDSTGMGLLVRFLTHARRKGGDLRLAGPTGLLKELLRLTGLDKVFMVYESEDDAIVSFLQEAAPGAAQAGEGPVILFFDHSADLGVFARSVLGVRGYEVLSVTLMSDARLLMTATKVDFIVVGPGSSKLPHETVVAQLKARAPEAKLVILPEDFRYQDADAAGLTLLRLLGDGQPS